mmetsp:Transcript_13999/g.31870  ORF Transcript_13999/g.31870 Transcript_13999/m.31870 type:complete len:264 (-) Transcript_13999:1119-1910(-)
MVRGASEVPPFTSVVAPRGAHTGRHVDVHGAAERAERVSVEVEGAKEVGVRRDGGCHVGLPEDVELNLGPGEQLVPQMDGKVWVDSCEDGDEMRLEILDLHFGDIATMTIRWNELELASVPDERFHCVGALVVKNVLLWSDAGRLDSGEEGEVRALHFFVGATGHRLDKDGVAVDFHHEHDVLVARLRRDGEAAGLIGEEGVLGFVDLDVDVADLLSSEVRAVNLLERPGLGLGRSYVLSLHIQVTRWCFCGFRIILADVFDV